MPRVEILSDFAAHFPASLSATNEHERVAIDQTHALARHALGEAAYDAALSRGAAMDDGEVVRYTVGELQRVAALLAQPGAQASDAPPGPVPEPPGAVSPRPACRRPGP